MKITNKILAFSLAAVLLIGGAGQTVFASDGDLQAANIMATYASLEPTIVGGFDRMNLIINGDVAFELNDISNVIFLKNEQPISDKVVLGSFEKSDYNGNTLVYIDFSRGVAVMSGPGVYKATFQYRGQMYCSSSFTWCEGEQPKGVSQYDYSTFGPIDGGNNADNGDGPPIVDTPDGTAETPKVSEWAKEEVAKAEDMGLIPESLKDADLTQPINRAEFAAVAVKTYEALSGVTALPAIVNPFTDTSDIEVLKAYNVGITTGTSANTFDPYTLLNREQAATMLTRVFKRATIPGWTIDTDGQFTLPYDKPAQFADDGQISDWAKDSVYFMAANEIIKGVGNNSFAPKNTTGDEEARGYANATREQALIIAVRMVENLK